MILSAVALQLLVSTTSAPAVEAHTVSKAQIEEMVRSSDGQLVAAAASESTSTPQVILVAGGEDRGFFEKYLPFTVADDLHPDIDQNLTSIWIVGALINLIGGPIGMLLGPLFIPKAMAGLEAGPDYTNEALIGGLVHAIMYVVSFPFIYFFGLGLIFILVNDVYLAPVAMVNTYNFHVGAGGGGKKKKKKRGGSALSDLPGMPTLAHASNGAAVAF